MFFSSPYSLAPWGMSKAPRGTADNSHSSLLSPSTAAVQGTCLGHHLCQHQCRSSVWPPHARERQGGEEVAGIQAKAPGIVQQNPKRNKKDQVSLSSLTCISLDEKPLAAAIARVISTKLFFEQMN